MLIINMVYPMLQGRMINLFTWNKTDIETVHLWL